MAIKITTYFFRATARALSIVATKAGILSLSISAITLPSFKKKGPAL
jgi:hypothetical protein